MPKENRKRGRWADGARKRKLQEGEGEGGDDEIEAPALKRRRSLDQNDAQEHHAGDLQQDYIPLQQDGDQEQDQQGDSRPFYGLLDDSEQEYFRRADDMLEVNQFSGPEERALFLENVYKEANGKELKMACSQSCSRLLERLILLSSSNQLKNLFRQFSGNFLHLVQHRFASHCCEALFLHAAPLVSQERLAPVSELPSPSPEENDSSEKLFLSAVNELKGNLGYLITDRFASHAIRLLLIVLSGQSLDVHSPNSLLKSRRKEQIDVAGIGQVSNSEARPRSVPDSFKVAMEQIMNESIAGLDSHYLRTLATHKVANPMLQLLLQLEATHFGKSKAKESNSIMKILLPDDTIAEGTESASFVNGLMYDSIGSRLLESIVKNAPGKIFKTLYNDLLKDRMGSLARNETAGYVVARVLERLSHDDLAEATPLILKQVPSLAERGRTAIIRVLIERCDVRKVDTTPILHALRNVYSEDGGVNFSLARLLCLPLDISMPTKAVLNLSNGNGAIQSDSEDSPPQRPSTSNSSEARPQSVPDASSTHASLLAQAMLKSPGVLSTATFASISTFSQELCLHMALSPHLSPVLQISLTVEHAPLIFRRKLITRFYSHVAALSLDRSGSHVVDSILHGTNGLAFVQERIAEELAENEHPLRENPYGRKVWRNWRMDLYSRRRNEWVKNTRAIAGNVGFLSFPNDESDLLKQTQTNSSNGNKPGHVSTFSKPKQRRSSSSSHPRRTAPTQAPVSGKSKLELARERFARGSKLAS